jgi:NADPH:quinone reductase-like Zn-dependent oxidoreductase
MPGDIIVQNGANSAVGQVVIQLAKDMGVRTINLIRDRVCVCTCVFVCVFIMIIPSFFASCAHTQPNVETLVQQLKDLGGDWVFTDDNLEQSRKIIGQLPKPVLGLNCVGGRSSSEIARVLADNGVLVTYGGMSRKPVQVPTGRLIFNNLQLRGFWLSRWIHEHSQLERQQMLSRWAVSVCVCCTVCTSAWVCIFEYLLHPTPTHPLHSSVTRMVKENKLKIMFERHEFLDFYTAIERARQGYRTNKVVLMFDPLTQKKKK